MAKLTRSKRLLIAIALICVALLYLNTRGNVRWRVHRHYPGAEVELRSEGTPVSSLDGLLLRSFGFRYLSPFESVGIRVSGSSTPIDFDHFRGMMISYLTIRDSQITDLRPLLTMYRPEVSIFHCDLTQLPSDQKACLHFQPDFDRYSIHIPSTMSPQYPGGIGLHSHSFYP